MREEKMNMVLPMNHGKNTLISLLLLPLLSAVDNS
jgi:hypothetical protein